MDVLQHCRPGILLLAILTAVHAPELRSQQPAQAADGVQAQIATAVAAYRAPARSLSVDYGATQALRSVYAQRTNAPLWSRDGHATAQAQALAHELQRADTYGLQREDYAGDAIAQLAEKPSDTAAAEAGRWARFDVQLSAAALRFMSDLHYGRVKPAAAGFNLQEMHQPLDLGAALNGLAATTDVGQAIGAIEPPFHHYALLKVALAKYLDLVQHPQLKQLPAIGNSLKPGDAYAGAPALRRLLVALGDLPAGSAAPADETTFGPELSDGVRAFQQRHGIAPDGVLGKSTFTVLTTSFAKRVRQIDLTLERWRWLPPFETPPIIVNIPQFRLFAFRTTEDRAADILQMDVIVGKTYPRTQTPVFESDMRYVVFRPYWDVPPSILRNEMLPKIRANPGYLAAQGLQIVNGQGDDSPVVPPSPEAIEALAAGKLRLRQMPGEDNALGLVKFMFPNTYNVYLHSTPAHRLFKESVRAFSHGCIRVSDPLALATHVMTDEPGGWTREKIDAAMNGSKTVRVNLQHPIRVLILYGTALATEAGPVLFFDDLYGLDKKLERQLSLAPPQ
ncbi:MAG TPA: L,D-transpeptidase family protein [Steroidobacteraceae bacterium]|jgi:murein L,D-transpeptidase YcbB/YkuD|nr:L,D-transpeptidase family protein [Steroidobacteraceae bacterium]